MWPHYAEVVQFEILKVPTDHPMWIYSRHNETVTRWRTEKSHPIDSETANRLKTRFGVDLDKIRQWCSSYPAQVDLIYFGKKAIQTYDLIFRIAGLNRKILALGKAATEGNEKAGEIVLLCESERQRLINALRGEITP